MKRAYGFTIVELLIVIVVIAILAAISVAAYGNISNRANDSAVQNDLANFAKQLKLIQVDEGAYPIGGGRRQTEGGSNVGAGTSFDGVRFRPSKGSYADTIGATNFVYCTGVGLVSGQPEFRVAGISKSGRAFTYSTIDGHQDLGIAATNTVSYEGGGCGGIGYPRSWSFGMYHGNWQSWTS